MPHMEQRSVTPSFTKAHFVQTQGGGTYGGQALHTESTKPLTAAHFGQDHIAFSGRRRLTPGRSGRFLKQWTAEQWLDMKGELALPQLSQIHGSPGGSAHDWQNQSHSLFAAKHRLHPQFSAIFAP
jgi:hypothetical protein